MLDIASGQVLHTTLDLGLGMAELAEAVTVDCQRAEDERPLAVVLSVRGGEVWPGTVGLHIVSKWECAVRRWERVGAMTVVVATGDCGGPALDLLMAADVRLSGSAVRISLPTTEHGFWPGMVVHRMANRIGVSRVRHLLLGLGSAQLTADRASELGILDEVHDDVDHRLAELLASRRPDAHTEMLRSLLLAAPSVSFEDALGAHLAACDRVLRTSSVAVDS